MAFAEFTDFIDLPEINELEERFTLGGYAVLSPSAHAGGDPTSH